MLVYNKQFILQYARCERKSTAGQLATGAQKNLCVSGY